MPNEKEVRAYELIFNAIAPGSEVRVTEDHVFINSSELSAEAMEQLLDKPGRFRNVVCKYVFVPENPEASAGVGLQNDRLSHDLTSRSKMPKLPQDFLTSLFGAVILKELNLDVSKLTEVDGNLVYKIENYALIKPIWDARLSMVKMILQNAGVAGIEQVFSSGTPLPLTAGKPLDADLTRNIADIIGIKFDVQADTAIFYLNREYLTSMVFAPEVVVDTKSQELRINKDQFSKYLARVFGDMVIPRQELLSGAYDEHSLVTPVIIPQVVANSLNKQNVYVFVIDVSSSLQGVAKQYKEQLLGILEKLLAEINVSSGGYVNAQDIIRLVFFSSKSRYVDFPVTAVLKDIEGLKQAIITTQVAGDTLLDGTILEQIDGLAGICNTESCNANMFIFTDGRDNESSQDQKDALLAHGDRYRAQETDLIPKFVIFRVGNSDVSYIDAISLGIDAQILDITDVSKLSMLFESIRDINLHRNVIQFVQEDRRTALSVYEGKIMTGPGLDLNKIVEIAGQVYAIAPSSDHIPGGGIKMLTADDTVVDVNDEFFSPSRYLSGLNTENFANSIAELMTAQSIKTVAYTVASGACMFMWQQLANKQNTLMRSDATCPVPDPFAYPTCRMDGI